MTSIATRDIRGYARERKFLVPALEAGRLLDWARRSLDPDPHGAGAFGDEYLVTTLYFDTAASDVFHRVRSFGRAKMRVRRYGQSPSVFLERKMRNEGLLAKRRTSIPVEDLARLTGPLDKTWIGAWFQKRLAKRELHPRCQLSYTRVARVGTNDGGPVRLTIDRDLRVLPASAIRLAPPMGLIVLPHHVVVEMKFHGEMPALGQQLMNDFHVVPQSVSKYRLGVAALEGIDVPGAAPADAPAKRMGERS